MDEPMVNGFGKGKRNQTKQLFETLSETGSRRGLGLASIDKRPHAQSERHVCHQQLSFLELP